GLFHSALPGKSPGRQAALPCSGILGSAEAGVTARWQGMRLCRWRGRRPWKCRTGRGAPLQTEVQILRGGDDDRQATHPNGAAAASNPPRLPIRDPRHEEAPSPRHSVRTARESAVTAINDTSGREPCEPPGDAYAPREIAARVQAWSVA